MDYIPDEHSTKPDTHVGTGDAPLGTTTTTIQCGYLGPTREPGTIHHRRLRVETTRAPWGHANHEQNDRDAKNDLIFYNVPMYA